MGKQKNKGAEAPVTETSEYVGQYWKSRYYVMEHGLVEGTVTAEDLAAFAKVHPEVRLSDYISDVDVVALWTKAHSVAGPTS